LFPSSLTSYNQLQTGQPNVVFMQNGQSPGAPLTCVCTQNPNPGLGAFNSGISSSSIIGQSSGQSTSFNVPENVPIDNILRQLGIDPHTIQRSATFPSSDPHNVVSNVWNAASHANPPHSINPGSSVSHVWNAATHANPPHPLNPNSAVSHVWNAATHANPPHPLDPNSAVSHAWNAATHANPPHPLDSGSAVSHVWNAAAHNADHNRPVSPSVGRAWDRIEQYLHPQSGDAVRSVWNHIPHQSSPPPSFNYPPPRNYSPPPPGNYPPSNYPPPNYSPPPPSNYPPQNYSPPPPSNYPPQNYSPPPQQPPPSSYPPPGGPNSSGASVLSRLFGGGR
ncbi:unnamed protein product, partial [Adineta steineri]